MKGCNEVLAHLSLCEKHFTEMRDELLHFTDGTSNSRKRKERPHDKEMADKSVTTGSSSVPPKKSGTKNDDNEKGTLLIYYSCIFI